MGCNCKGETKEAITNVCHEGSFRIVKCPKNGRDVTQRCVNNTWVNVD